MPLLIIIGIPGFLILKLVRPWILIRIHGINCGRIGHFAGNMELYCCEMDAGINKPLKRFADFFFLNNEPVCNEYLAALWKKKLRILPFWVLYPIRTLIRFIPGSASHLVYNHQHNDRDIHCLMDKYPAHLQISEQDEILGLEGLKNLGIPSGAKFVTLLVRDNKYLSSINSEDWNYHSYRDCNIENYILAAEELTKRGYYVIRMGKIAKTPIITDNQKIIDYAFTDHRSDFMDIFLGAKCEFCITTGAGWDNVPAILFRKPVIFTNLLPLGRLSTFSSRFIQTTKKHVNRITGKELTMIEIFEIGLGYVLTASEFEEKNVILYENDPVEIKDVVMEMLEAIINNGQFLHEDEVLQHCFWNLYARCLAEFPFPEKLHGQLNARFSSRYLSKNEGFLQ